MRVIKLFMLVQKTILPSKSKLINYFKNWWLKLKIFRFDEPMTVKLIEDLLTRLHEAGFDVVAMVSDLGPDNRTLINSLGADEDTPWMLHPCTSEKVYILSDIPHLIKLARNHLFDQGFLLNPGAENGFLIASKEPLKELLELSTMLELQSHKFTWEHYNAEGSDRQFVSFATQTLSSSVAACLREAAEKKLINSRHTEVKSDLYFSKKVNRSF
jgi:hypothetical protein